MVESLLGSVLIRFRRASCVHNSDSGRCEELEIEYDCSVDNQSSKRFLKLGGENVDDQSTDFTH